MTDRSKPEAPELSAAERVRVEAFGIHPELDEGDG